MLLCWMNTLLYLCLVLLCHNFFLKQIIFLLLVRKFINLIFCTICDYCRTFIKPCACPAGVLVNDYQWNPLIWFVACTENLTWFMLLYPIIILNRELLLFTLMCLFLVCALMHHDDLIHLLWYMPMVLSVDIFGLIVCFYDKRYFK